MSRRPSILCLLPVLCVTSCIPPKAIVVTEIPAPVANAPKPDVSGGGGATAESQPNLPKHEADTLRMPNMLELPSDRDTRLSNATGGPNDGAPVIARPPSDKPAASKSN